MTHASCPWRIAAPLAALIALACLGSAAAPAAPATPELQKLVRAGTFEVVLKRPEKDLLTYEKPLPLELIPYTERIDKYQSIGTAFAISAGVYVSAGHVMTSGMGSLFGAPAIRDSNGNVYPIERVLKYSQHEDFMVFSVANGPPAQPLEISGSPAIDEQVYSVGNALGDGIVIRDGLLTSMTAEDQDGRWKWLRFSAAASPGNSGGPLLNARGQVVGLVTAKSPGENLNYALPIERVQSAVADLARYDLRQSVGITVLNDRRVAVLKAEFKLPASYPDFSRQHRQQFLQLQQKETAALFAEQAAVVFPKGAASRLLATTDTPRAPALIAQEADGSWTTDDGELSEKGELQGEGFVELRMVQGSALFRLKRGDNAFDDAFYSDSRLFMDNLLKGSKLTRQVGSQAIRVTSAGTASTDSLFTDPVGRRWQIRTWPLPYMDATVIVAALATPDGYVGFLRIGSAFAADLLIEDIHTLTRFFQTPMSGTMAQWQGYLGRKALRAATFETLQIEQLPSQAIRVESPRLRAVIPAELLRVDKESVLRIGMVFIPVGDKLRWEPGTLLLMKEPEGESYVSIGRQPRPAPDAGREVLLRWDRMLKREDRFDGRLAHDESYQSVSVRTSLAKELTATGTPSPTSSVLYETVYRTQDRLLPREMETRRTLLLGAVKVLEP